jgi:small-conductance mechanosensitive channel
MTALIALTVAMMALHSPAMAQSPLQSEEQQASSQPADSADAVNGAAAGDDSASRAAALAAALRDPALREALLEELDRLAGAEAEGTTTANAAADAPPGATGGRPPADQPVNAQTTNRQADAAANGVAANATPEATVGHQLARLTRNAADGLRAEGQSFLDGLAITQRRLTALTDQRAAGLFAALQTLVGLIIITVVTHVILHRLARRWFTATAAAAAAAGPLKRVMMWLGRLIVGALTVIAAWAIGHLISVGALAGGAESTLFHALYLNAFLIAQFVRVGIRALMAPETPALRVAPMSAEGARYWNRGLGALSALLIYGLLFLTPLIGQTVSVFTARAFQGVVYAVAVLWAMGLVIGHRKDPSIWLTRRAEAAGGDPTLRLLAFFMGFWHWPALAWLTALFVTAVSRSGAVGPMLLVSARVAGVVIVGALIGALMARGAKKGVHLPPDLTASAPLLEERLNDFILRFLGAARFILALATIGVAIDVSGLYDMGGWFTRRFGDDFLGVVVSVALIVTVAFALWLALASYVDYRLNSDRPDAPTARERTLLTLMRNAATIALAVITLMVTLSEIGLDIAPLLASAGVLGLAIGFGAQRMVQDIITGIFIQFENAINVGDVVTVAGTTGAVEKLTIRSVSLRTLDGAFHIIPFSSVDMVTNFMRGFAFHVAEMGIAYREDVSQAKTLMHQAFDELKATAEHGPNILGMLDWHGLTEFGDSAVMVRARIRTRPGAQWAIGRAYNEIVKRLFDEHGVEIPFPHMTVWFGENKDGTAPAARLATTTSTVGAVGAAGAAAAPTLHEAASPQRRNRGGDAPNERDGDDNGDWR